jgi:hypothetical protein
LARGEAEAIALAVEQRVDRPLIDERQGRITAEGMGVRAVGSIGIVVAAEARGEVGRLAPLLGDLRASGLWMSGRSSPACWRPWASRAIQQECSRLQADRACATAVADHDGMLLGPLRQ